MPQSSPKTLQARASLGDGLRRLFDGPEYLGIVRDQVLSLTRRTPETTFNQLPAAYRRSAIFAASYDGQGA